MADLTPYISGESRRLARFTQQAIDRQDHLAMVRARSVQSVAFVTEVAMFSVANLSNMETELVKAVPLAEPRLEVIVNTATALIAGQLSRLARDLG